MPKQHYIGVKMIQAEPMTNREFHLGIPHDDDQVPGYRVTYPDGYVSWSPADVFESAYFPLDDASRITSADVDRFAGPVASQQLDAKSTLASVETLTGFVQHEVSSCVDAANFDMAIGAKIGYERIKSKLWGHMGFLLQWARFGLTAHVAAEEPAERLDRLKVRHRYLHRIMNGVAFKLKPIAEQSQIETEWARVGEIIRMETEAQKPHTEAECGPGCTRPGCAVQEREPIAEPMRRDALINERAKLVDSLGVSLAYDSFALVDADAKAMNRREMGKLLARITKLDTLTGHPACPPDCGCAVCVTGRLWQRKPGAKPCTRRHFTGSYCECELCSTTRAQDYAKLEPNAPIWQPVPGDPCTQCGKRKVPNPADFGEICPDGCDAPKEGWIGPQCPKCYDCCRWTEPDADGRSYCTACRSHGSEGLDKIVATIRKVVDSNADKPQVASGKPPHVERMIDEAVQLREKLGKLKAFMILPMYEKIDKAEQKRMNRQRMGMEDYLRALDERIEVALEGLNKRDTNVAPVTGIETNPKETPDHDAKA